MGCFFSRWLTIVAAGIYLFKVNNEKIRTVFEQFCLKLIVATSERRQWLSWCMSYLKLCKKQKNLTTNFNRNQSTIIFIKMSIIFIFTRFLVTSPRKKVMYPMLFLIPFAVFLESSYITVHHLHNLFLGNVTIL